MIQQYVLQYVQVPFGREWPSFFFFFGGTKFTHARCINRNPTFKTFYADRHNRQFAFWIKFDTSAAYEPTVVFLPHLHGKNATYEPGLTCSRHAVLPTYFKFDVIIAGCTRGVSYNESSFVINDVMKTVWRTRFFLSEISVFPGPGVWIKPVLWAKRKTFHSD